MNIRKRVLIVLLLLTGGGILLLWNQESGTGSPLAESKPYERAKEQFGTYLASELPSDSLLELTELGLQEAIQADPGWDSYFLLGILRHYQGQTSSAIAELEKGITETGAHPLLHLLQGIYLLEQDQKKEAKAAFLASLTLSEQALEFNPLDLDAIEWKTMALIFSGERSSGEDFLRGRLEQYPYEERLLGLEKDLRKLDYLNYPVRLASHWFALPARPNAFSFSNHEDLMRELKGAFLEVIADTLPIFAPESKSADSTFYMAGLDSTLLGLFPSRNPETDIFARFTYPLDPIVRAYVVVETHPVYPPRMILYPYHAKRKRFLNPILLAGPDSESGLKKSWILDLNEDGSPDILSHALPLSSQLSHQLAGLSFSARIWKNGRFNSEQVIAFPDSLYKKLELDLF